MALDLEAGREREEVEGPLVAVHELRRLAGTDVDDLGQVQLVARAVVAQHRVEGPEHRGVGRERTEGRRTVDEASGTTRAVAAEVVGTDGGGVEVRAQLRLDGVHHVFADEAIDHRTAGVVDRGGDLIGRRVGRQHRHRHLASMAREPAPIGRRSVFWP